MFILGSSRVARVATMAAVVLLAGCAQSHKPLYSWDSYQPGVYAYLKGEGDYSTQIAAFEQNLETARASGEALPPGFHAHLGMLYFKDGRNDKGVEQILTEKAAFPESTAFMDFILKMAAGVEVPAASASSGETSDAGAAAVRAPAGGIPASATKSSDAVVENHKKKGKGA